MKANFSSRWLQRGSMFVLSLQQFLKLLRVSDSDSWHKDSLLDLGAGDGEVTAHLSPLFTKTYVTEVSTTMQSLLQNRGYSYVFNFFLCNKPSDCCICKTV